MKDEDKTKEELIRDLAGLRLRVSELEKSHQECRRSEENTARNEELLRKVLEVLPVGVWITDRDGRILHGNPAGQRVWEGARYVGIDRYGEYKGWWMDTGKLIEPQEWAAARAITKGETSINEKIEIECFDGTHKYILNSAVPIRSSKGEVLGTIIVNQDITEIKRGEDELKKLNIELNEALRKVKILSGMIPICAHCKKIRDDSGFWNQLEKYISEHSEAEFTHSICPQCAKELYPEFYRE